jgi:CDP-paratose 2-epimerase
VTALLVTGSSGLIGAEVVAFFAERDYVVHGIDNNMREAFFGPEGSTLGTRSRLERDWPNFRHYELDVRDRSAVMELVRGLRPTAIVHAAAQPSHDRAAAIPFDDFDINAVGTLNLLEASRRFCPNSPFVHMSTNKVYGDAPNQISLVEIETRWDFAAEKWQYGIPENFPIDQSKHSLFGASKLAADVLVQEYGRYFKMPTCCLRGGCLTGPNHSGVELHGFLSYLIKCNVEGRRYNIFGHKAKQVRDNIHSWDVANFISEFIAAPRVAEVYNIGGGRQNSLSILEAIQMIESLSGKKMISNYEERPREGDHIVYYSDLRKIQAHYPNWFVTRDLKKIFEEVLGSWEKILGQKRLTAPA